MTRPSNLERACAWPGNIAFESRVHSVQKRRTIAMLRKALVGLAFLVMPACVLAQGAGGGGSSGGGAGAGGSRGGGAATAAPPAGQGNPAAGGAQAPFTSNTLSAPAPGVGNTPVDPQRNNVDGSPPSRRLPARAPNAGTAPSPTGADAQRLQPGYSSGGVPGRQTDPSVAEFESCLSLWDSGTHMSKSEWRATCRRVQNRLSNLKIREPTERAGKGQSLR